MILGCAFVVLVMWGYRWAFGPSKPQPVEAGEVRTLVLHGADGADYVGRRCRVYAEWVAVETGGGVVLIPRERVQVLRVAP